MSTQIRPGTQDSLRKAVWSLFAVLVAISSDAAQWLVTNTSNSGSGSLRQAILNANAASGRDSIRFGIPGPGPFTIRPTSPLPDLTDSVIIDGTTQPGYAGQPLIEVNGGWAGASGVNGFTISGSGNCTLRGLVINGFSQNAIWLNGGNKNVVEGCFLGTDRSGTSSVPNGFGIWIWNSLNNQIGGASASARNVISGNQFRGIEISAMIGVSSAQRNRVEGNLIGTDASGTRALPNGFSGILIAQCPGNTIGGADPGARNVISGNTFTGIEINLSAASNVVQGNFIGTDLSGTDDLGNGEAGILIIDSSGNAVGGSSVGEANVLSGNGLSGVEVSGFSSLGNIIEGNLIGTDATGATALGNNQGVLVHATRGTRIGGTSPGTRNVISGNDPFLGIIVQGGARDTIIQGNYIGTDITGTAPLGNAMGGINLREGASSTVIGGTDPEAANVISGNTLFGVEIEDSETRANRVEGNFIGTDVSGTNALGNGAGVLLDNLASNNRIGGTNSSVRNVISGNTLHGVTIRGGATGNCLQGNYIGPEVTGWSNLGNGESGVLVESAGNVIGPGNIISGNGLHGVELRFAAADNSVEGNFIGTDSNGTGALGNGHIGVYLHDGAADNRVGGASPHQGNLISGNQLSGIILETTNTTGNHIAGNWIGIDISGLKALGNGEDGIGLLGARDNTIGGIASGARNIISGNGRLGRPNDGRSGIEIWEGASGNLVQGNFLGTDVSGTVALPNREYGIFIQRSPNNTIGGTATGQGNLIAGNLLDGVYIEQAESQGNQIYGNQIGTDVSGATALANGDNGVRVNDAPNTLIGGPATGRNLISGNAQAGIMIEGTNARRTRIRNNLIGTAITGTLALGNGAAGVHLRSGATLTTIGHSSTAGRNVISANGQHGVHIEHDTSTNNLIVGNFIGTDLTGTNALGNTGSGVRTSRGASGNTIGGPGGNRNTIAFNSVDGVHLRDGTQNLIRNNLIFSNGGLGINLGLNEVTLNDAGDVDSGANGLLNFPVLHSAVALESGTTVVTGTLDSLANTTFTLEFFANAACDPTGYGEGAEVLGMTDVTTAGTGQANFTVTFSGGPPAGRQVTVTATDPLMNTSEFSACIRVAPEHEPPRLVVTRDGANLTVRWPAAAGFNLYCATNLTAPIQWVAVTNGVVSVNATNQVVIEPDAGNQFFRLSNP